MRQVVEDSEDAEEMILTNEVGRAGVQEVLFVQRLPAIDQTFVRSASVQKVRGAPYPYVEIEFTDPGRERFAQLTRQSIGKRLAIVVDGTLLSAPRILAEISDGKVWIAGRFTQRDASDLAKKINSTAKR